ncbi:MAG: acyl-CoA synthetase [Pseudomonadota bacterium]
MSHPFESGLDRCPANHVPLSPISFLRRTAAVHGARTAIVHGTRRQSWADTERRCRRLASALVARGIGQGDVVSILAPNIPEVVEAHFGVPMAGAVLNAINTRLDAATVAFILEHGGAKLLLADREYAPVVQQALAVMEDPPAVVDIDDPLAEGGAAIGAVDYEAFLAGGDPAFAPRMPGDEWDAIALNYTSGTTGNPKGVVYHHRGAYLNTLGNAVTWPMPHYPVYLWTLPMFHCNGWCFPWTITALGGTHVCLRRIEGAAILQAIAEQGITHLCGAPIVMGMMLEAGGDAPRWSQAVSMMTAGAAPPAAVLGAMEELGIDVTHVYGLTEVYGPAVVCAWNPDWTALPVEEKAAIKARQGVPYEVQEGLMVADPETLEPVPQDGETMGEIMMRGNIVMKGYLKNSAATEAAFAGGWFHTDDLAVWHADGYVEIKDRSKDIIISGGENISSIEVEDVLYKLPAVAVAAVVAKPDPKWGETPCAFIELKPGAALTEPEAIAFCRERLAHFKAPRRVVFGALPKTSTGKIQKFALRERARQMDG